MKTIIPISLAVASLCAAGCSTPSATRSSSSSSPGSPAPSPIATAPASSPKTGVTALEGAWHGHEITPDGQAPASITFSGQSMEFHGADPNDWAKGTFTLSENVHPEQLVGLILDCPDPNAIGKKGCAIIKIEGGRLILTGSGPGGVMDFPSDFDSPGTRRFVFKRD